MKRILDWKLFNESVSSELDEDIKWALIDLIDYGFKITQIDHHKYDHVSSKGEYDTEIEELLISLNLKQTVVWSSINSINVKFDIDGSFEVYELNAFYDGASKPKSEYDEIEDMLSRESSKMENELIELMKNSVGNIMDTCGYNDGEFRISEHLLPVFGAYNSDDTRDMSFNINLTFRRSFKKNI